MSGVTERFAEAPPSAWTEMDDAEYAVAWSSFRHRFGFRASTTPDGWPGIEEPTPSVAFDLASRRTAAHGR
jgi:hypothetical protein